MKIGVIQASSQADKNELLYDTVFKHTPEGAEVINFGCTKEEKDRYSYIDIMTQILQRKRWIKLLQGLNSLGRTTISFWQTMKRLVLSVL